MSRMLAALTLLFGMQLAIPLHAEAVASGSSEWMTRVLKVVVTRSDGGREIGSAVPLSGDRMVTNCHVTRYAADITVVSPSRSWKANADLRDAYRDLCFLNVPGYRGKTMPMIETGKTRVGLDVLAVGYSDGMFGISEGEVVGLHTCECDGGKVIQTSAPFDRGASGGGLFDKAGRLVGILTFKSKSGGNFHFALPVGWLRHIAANNVQPIVSGKTFWEQPGKESAYFLAACDLGAQKKWQQLSTLAGEWTEQEPDNPEAWMALGRSQLGMRQSGAAASSFQHVLMLDSTHAEAKWELQKLEFELGRRLPDGGGV
jgi:Trypsin-like peptidase domain